MSLALALPFSTSALVPALPFVALAIVTALIFVALALASPFLGSMLELREPKRHDVVVALLEVVSPLRNTLARTKDTDSLDTDSRDTDSADALPLPTTDLLENRVLAQANGLC